MYDVDAEQDASDLAVAHSALDVGLPPLPVCRSLQVANVALGGTLQQDMGGPGREHRHLVHPVDLKPDSVVARATGADKVEASCYHHQRLDVLGHGLTATALAADGTIEAQELPDARGWFAAVHWHPEDIAAHDPAQQCLFGTLVRTAAFRTA